MHHPRNRSDEISIYGISSKASYTWLVVIMSRFWGAAGDSDSDSTEEASDEETKPTRQLR